MRRERKIHLRRPLDQKVVQAKLIAGVTVDEVDEAMGLWSPYLKDKVESGAARPQHAHWDWSRKARAVEKVFEYQICGVSADDSIQALMLREDTRAFAKHPDQIGSPIVYVVFLSTAPWNDAAIVPTPVYRGCGSQLLRESIEYSIELGYKGRVGLHALPQSEEFYARRCGMIDLGIDPEPAHQGLRYFEFTKEGAKNFLSRQKKEN